MHFKPRQPAATLPLLFTPSLPRIMHHPTRSSAPHAGFPPTSGVHFPQAQGRTKQERAVLARRLHR